MAKLVLVLNCGSSSIKFAVLNPGSGANKLTGLVQSIDSKDANMSWKQSGEKQLLDLPNINYHLALDKILHLVLEYKELASQIIAVGHRVVHGDEKFTESTLITDEVLEAIRECQTLAPLHNPANISGIEAAKKAFPTLPHVAVFDTAFHQSMPQYAYTYAIPYRLYTEHKIRRYGFHGTSHRYVSREAVKLLDISLDQSALITAHLGNGCSICAIKNGNSIDTSMGLTPLEGLVMGTRCGDVDPGLHAHLVAVLGYDIHRVNTLLNKESGMLGISGLDSDLRVIESAIEQGNEQAKLAMDVFCYRLAKYIGAYTVALGSLDALVFTGGIGENSYCVRANTMKWLSVLGFTLDDKANAKNGKESDGLITTPTSKKALVVPTNEELLIAQDALELGTPL